MKVTLILAIYALAEIHGTVAFTASNNIRTTEVRLSTTQLFEAPLARQGDWAAYLDEENTGLVYYFNKRTGESLWQAPSDTFPDVYLTSQQRAAAKAKQAEYKDKMKAEEIEKKKSKTPAVKPVEAEAKKEQSKWFDSIFDTKVERSVVEKSTVIGDVGDRNVDMKDERAVAEKKKEEAKVDEEESKRIGGVSDKTSDEAGKEKSAWFDGIFAKKEDMKSSPNIEDSAALVVESVVDEESTEPTLNYYDLFGGASMEDASTKVASTKVVPDSSQPKFSLGNFMSAFQRKPGDDTDSESDRQAQSTKTSAKAKKESESMVATKPKVGVSNTDNQVKSINIEMSTYVLPHPEKVRWGGEDAVFAKGRTFGVFDGVSGAVKLDGVPLYSTTLAKEMKKTVGDNFLDLKEITALLTTAADYADEKATGASTAVVGSVSADGRLSVLNVGDSYCYVIRDGKVAVKSKEIVHFFECPYQLSEDSPDRPKDGTKLNTNVQTGDVILMGSDGLFDNLSDDVILRTVASVPARASVISRKLVDLSRTVSLDVEADTPFAKLAKRAGFEGYENGRGGKVDDISCVVVCCK